MTDVLYRWPEAAKFGRRVPKEKFYEHGTVSTAIREKFINEVQRITWAYKLAEATINLPGVPTVPEIQVFTIDAKTDDVSEAVLGAIDKAIPFPIIFEIARQRGEQPEARTVAAHKQLGAGTPKLSAYYSTAWQPGDTSRQALPTAITLPAPPSSWVCLSCWPSSLSISRSTRLLERIQTDAPRAVALSTLSAWMEISSWAFWRRAISERALRSTK